jgi:YgiT-type zinc finger domain-containing protein
MICLICRQSETVDGFTVVFFERGEFRLVVQSVPASLCRGCGEAYVVEDVAARLLRDAEEISKTGILDAVREYK